MGKIYRGWMMQGEKHCLFETFRKTLEIGDVITDAFGEKWKIEIIF